MNPLGRPGPAAILAHIQPMHPDTARYNQSLEPSLAAICDRLAKAIARELPDAENQIWHAHPVWFLDGNPIVGYSKLKAKPGSPDFCIRLLFWSGRSFEETGLQEVGGFQTAEARYTAENQIPARDLKRWLQKARDIQWDYKNIVRRKGRLERLK